MDFKERLNSTICCNTVYTCRSCWLFKVPVTAIPCPRCGTDPFVLLPSNTSSFSAGFKNLVCCLGEAAFLWLESLRQIWTVDALSQLWTSRPSGPLCRNSGRCKGRRSSDEKNAEGSQMEWCSQRGQAETGAKDSSHSRGLLGIKEGPTFLKQLTIQPIRYGF